MTALAAGCLVLAVVTVAWPASRARQRRRRLVPSGPAHARPRERAAWRALARPPRPGPGAPPTVGVVAGLVAAVVAAALAAGPVAGAVTAGYGTLAARTLRARATGRERARHRAALLDALSGAAADLRAGLPADRAMAGLTSPAPGHLRDALPARVRAVTRLAERTGAPLAELLERIEADARAGDRARAALAGQAAGSLATAYLLAVLPAAGIGLGYAIGADPLAVLLGTPIGAACALGAATLQLAGLAWAGRIARPEAVTGP